MTKKLNIGSITNELAGSVFFRPKLTPDTQGETPAAPLSEQPQQLPPAIPTARPGGEAVYRPDDRPTGKGILVRRGFEWREDQLRALKQLSLKEQMAGKQGSMSQMVRDAVDEYLRRRAVEE
jgi:hypothetical protein